MDDNAEDQRLPHHRNPKQFVSLDYLSGFSLSFSPLSLLLTFSLYKSLFQFGLKDFADFADLGVLYWKLNPKDYENDLELKEIRESRGYNYMVFIFSLKKLGFF